MRVRMVIGMDTLDIVLVIFFVLLFGSGCVYLGIILNEVKHLNKSKGKPIEIEWLHDGSRDIIVTMRGQPVFTGSIIDMSISNKYSGPQELHIGVVSKAELMERHYAVRD
jgi:hypothetical protein